MYYCYLSDGTKLSLGSSTSTLTQRYRGSLVYNNGQFESASFGSGRIVGTDNGSEVHYFLTDHLGSTRVVAKVTPTGREDLDRKITIPSAKSGRNRVCRLPTIGICSPAKNGATYVWKTTIPVSFRFMISGLAVTIRRVYFSCSKIRSWRNTTPSDNMPIVRGIR